MQDPIPQMYKNEIKHSNGVYMLDHDKLNKTVVRLNNQMNIFFIENPESSISSAHMCVGVGSADDPIGNPNAGNPNVGNPNVGNPNVGNPSDSNQRQLDGMAHYLEHMLFMGSDKYHGESYFQNMVIRNSGMSNAYTTDTSTQYFFNCSGNFLELLDIFSRFFVKPLFDTKYVEKEVSAVDSEHNKNIGSDGWRIQHLSKIFFPTHTNYRFTTGNRHTLLGSCGNDPSILRDELIRFYEKFYQPNRMVLVVYHSSLDTPQINTIKQMFEQVPTKSHLSVPRVLADKSNQSDNLGNPDQSNRFQVLYVRTISNTDMLGIRWHMPCSTHYIANIQHDAYDVMIHLLAHRGEQSLYSILCEKNIITDLHVSLTECPDTSNILSLSFDLTTKGTKQWQRVVYLVDWYIQNLAQANDIFENYARETNELSYLNLKTMDMVDGLELSQLYIDTFNMKHIDLGYVCVAPLLARNRKEQKKHFYQMIGLMGLDRMKVIYGSSGISNDLVDQTDVYYGTQYGLRWQTIDIKMANKAKQREPMYPKYNTYLDDSIHIRVVDPIIPNDPMYCKIYSTSHNIYYLKKSNPYQTYQYSGVFSVQPPCNDPVNQVNPIDHITSILYIAMIERAHQSDIYQLDQIGTQIRLSRDGNYLTWHISGYVDNIATLVSSVVGWYQDTNLTISQYKRVWNETSRWLRDYRLSDPHQMVIPEFMTMVNRANLSNAQLLGALKQLKPATIDLAQFQMSARRLIFTGAVRGVMGGSIQAKQMLSITRLFDHLYTRRISIDHKSIDHQPVVQTHVSSNPHNRDNAIGYGLYCGLYVSDNLLLERAYCSMCESYISDRFFALVRTEQQVGYIARCRLINVNRMDTREYFLVFIVQSQRDDLTQIVESFVNTNMVEYVAQITSSEFDLMRDGLCARLKDKPQQIHSDVADAMVELVSRQHSDVFADCERFDQKYRIGEMLAHKGTLKGFVGFVKKLVGNIRSIVRIDRSG
jgi:insulysin